MMFSFGNHFSFLVIKIQPCFLRSNSKNNCYCMNNNVKTKLTVSDIFLSNKNQKSLKNSKKHL